MFRGDFCFFCAIVNIQEKLTKVHPHQNTAIYYNNKISSASSKVLSRVSSVFGRVSIDLAGATRVELCLSSSPVKMAALVPEFHIESRVIDANSRDEVSLTSVEIDISALINSARSPW